MLVNTCEISIKPPKLEFDNRYVDELLSKLEVLTSGSRFS